MASSWSAGLFDAASKVASRVKEKAAKAKENAAELSSRAKSEAFTFATAMKNQAIADKQYLEKAKLKSISPKAVSNVVYLPWECQDEKLADEARERILASSCNKDTFSIDPPSDWTFEFQNYVDIAMKLLEIDQNLQRMHSKLSMRVSEEKFWKSYFYKCFQIREELNMDVLYKFDNSESDCTENEATKPSSASENETITKKEEVDTGAKKEDNMSCQVLSPKETHSLPDAGNPTPEDSSSSCLDSSWEDQFKADLGIDELELLRDMDDDNDCELHDEELEKQIVMELSLSTPKDETQC